MRVNAFCSIVVFAFSALGCGAPDSEHPPLVSDRCGSDFCTQAPVTGVGRKPSDDDTPAPGDAGLAPSGEGSLSAEVVILTTPDLVQSLPLSLATLELRVEAADGTSTSLRHESGSFDLELRGRAPHWLSLRQTEGVQELMTTILPVEAGSGSFVPIVERRVVEDIAENLPQAVLVPLADRAHAILHFTRSRLPLAGVSVAVAEGTIAYDLGALYSDALEATADRGAAALINLPAVPFPGGSLDIQVAFEGETLDFELQVAQDAVTLTTFEL